MKKIISFILVGFFILGGLTAVSGNENLVNSKILESIDTEIHIAPITIPNNHVYQIINGNEELKFYTITYNQDSKNVDNNKEIKERSNNPETYDYVIITTETLYNSIISSTRIESWLSMIRTIDDFSSKHIEAD